MGTFKNRAVLQQSNHFMQYMLSSVYEVSKSLLNERLVKMQHNHKVMTMWHGSRLRYVMHCYVKNTVKLILLLLLLLLLMEMYIILTMFTSMHTHLWVAYQWQGNATPHAVVTLGLNIVAHQTSIPKWYC